MAGAIYYVGTKTHTPVQGQEKVAGWGGTEENIQKKAGYNGSEWQEVVLAHPGKQFHMHGSRDKLEGGLKPGQLCASLQGTSPRLGGKITSDYGKRLDRAKSWKQRWRVGVWGKKAEESGPK